VAAPASLQPFVGRFTEAEFTVVADSAGCPALRMVRGPMPPVLLRPYAHEGASWTFTDGRSRFTFEPAVGGASPAVWGDMGVSLVHWKRGA
jgi:hypothetical protein